MKKYLIVSATNFEIANTQSNSLFDVLITQVGAPYTLFHLQQHLRHHQYETIIQIGFAGVYASALNDKNWQLGQLVEVYSDGFGDIGALENNQFRSVQDMHLSENQPTIINPHTTSFGLPKANAITNNTITDNQKIIAIQQQYWQADIETMEGAALHLLGHQMNLHYLQIRALSNIIGDRNKANWAIPQCIANIKTFIEQLD